MTKSRDEEGSAAELRRKVTLLARDLDEAREQQAATADVLKVISRSGFDLDAVLTTLIASAIKLCDAERGVIWLRRGEQLFLAAHVNYAPEWVSFAEANPITPAAGAQTTSGIAAFTGEVVNVEDVFADPRFRSLAGHSLGNYRAGLAVPLKRDGGVVGVISLSRPDVRLFTERQVALVQTFADQAVIAIENVRLFEEARTRNRELSEALEQQMATSAILRVISSSPTNVQPVFDAIAENAARLCEAFDAVIRLKEGDTLALGAHYGSIPVDPKPWAISKKWTGGRAVLERATIHVRDLVDATEEFPEGSAMAHRVGHRTMLAVPLLREGEAIGVIGVRRAEVKPFSEKQISLLKTFADQAVIAIENVRLFDEVRARNRDLSETLEQQVATSAILRAIAASPTDIQPVLDAVTENAAQLCEAYDSTILLRRGEVLAVAAHRGAIAIDFAELPLQRDVVTSRAVLDRTSVHVHDLSVEKDEFPTGSALALRLGFRTVLSTPLLREGEAIGALMIRRAEVRPFSERQVELLKTFADQAVIAIENVRLFEEVQARNRALNEFLEQQTAMSGILRVISRSPTDIQPVFETIAESAARLCQARFCAVFRFDGDLIHFMAQHGMSPEADDLQRRAFPSPPGRTSAAARAMLSGRVEEIPDVEADPDFALGSLTRTMGVRGVVSVPMLRDGRPVGAINITRAEPGYFPDGQIELLKTFADQAVIAIENVRLFDEVQARNRDLTESLERQTALTVNLLSPLAKAS